MFSFGKKEEKNSPECACNRNYSAEDIAEMDIKSCCGTVVNGICCIKVLGAGCKSCHELYENTKKAVAEMGLAVEVEYITDMQKIMEYGVMSMPALVVNEKVASMGKVLKAAEVKKLLEKESV